MLVTAQELREAVSEHINKSEESYSLFVEELDRITALYPRPALNGPTALEVELLQVWLGKVKSHIQDRIRGRLSEGAVLDGDGALKELCKPDSDLRQFVEDLKIMRASRMASLLG